MGTTSTQVSFLRVQATTQFNIGITFSGLGTFYMPIVIGTDHPVSILPLPVSPFGILPVSINVAGVSLMGQFTLENGTNTCCQNPLTVNVNFTAVEDTKIAQYQLLNSSFSIPFSATFRLKDLTTGNNVATWGPKTYQTVDHYGNSTFANYTVIPDGDSLVNSTMTLAVAMPPEGPPTPGLGIFQLTYWYDNGWKFARVVRRGSSIPIPIEPVSMFGIWIYGDGKVSYRNFLMSYRDFHPEFELWIQQAKLFNCLEVLSLGMALGNS